MSLAGIMRENKQTNSFEGWATRPGSILLKVWRRRYDCRHTYDQDFFFLYPLPNVEKEVGNAMQM